MRNVEIKCCKCGEIFIIRANDNVRNPKFCPICSKKYFDEKKQINKQRDDIAWQIKHDQDVLLFEENLKAWNLLSLIEMEGILDDNLLYVIGNGFDMMHGVKSSYYDFSKTIGKRCPIRFYLEYYLKADDLWADFEGALGKINIEAMCQPYIIDNFLDMMGAYDEDAGVAEIYISADMAAEPIVSMSTDLMKRFRKWVCSLFVNTNDRPLRNVIKPGKVLNFNYTEFIEDMYGVDESNICYIHGCRKKRGKQEQELILGHIPGANDSAYSFDDNYSIIDNLDEHIQTIYDVQQITMEMVRSADDTLTKNCDMIIHNNEYFFQELADVKQVVVIGHSLYPVDWDYFAEIIRRSKDSKSIKWFFGCYGNDDLERIHVFINNFGIDKAQVSIFRTDTISVDLLISNKPKIQKEKRKILTVSDDGKLEVSRLNKKFDIIDKASNNIIYSRIFYTYMSGAVFNKTGTVLLLVARGIDAGVFLLKLVDNTWQYVGELESIPHQNLINKRLHKILLDGANVSFIYNNRIRKYAISDGSLVYNKSTRHAFESEYEGEDLTGKFEEIYKTGFY